MGTATTSVGAINGAMVAADQHGAAHRLAHSWADAALGSVGLRHARALNVVTTCHGGYVD